MASSGLTRSVGSFHLDEKWKKLSKKEGFNVDKKTHKHGRCTFTRKCARLVKEQRARFYIMRRCVIMLVCWRDNYSDS